MPISTDCYGTGDSGPQDIPVHYGTVIVECWGSGSSGATSDSAPGDGGGGGAYSKKTLALAAGTYTVFCDNANAGNSTYLSASTDPSGATPYCKANSSIDISGGVGGVGDLILNGGDGDGGGLTDGGHGGNVGDQSAFGGAGGTIDNPDGVDAECPGAGGGGAFTAGIPGEGCGGQVCITYQTTAPKAGGCIAAFTELGF